MCYYISPEEVSTACKIPDNNGLLISNSWVVVTHMFDFYGFKLDYQAFNEEIGFADKLNLKLSRSESESTIETNPGPALLKPSNIQAV